MALKSDAKYDEKLTCGLENDMSNLEIFTENIFESLTTGTLMGGPFTKVENV